jgi:hypothetical protein
MAAQKMPYQIGKWSATTTVGGIDTVKLTVSGVVQEPTPGYVLTLQRVNPPATDLDTLFLALTEVPPTGVEPDHVTDTPVEFTETFVVSMHRPSRAIILGAMNTVDIPAAS